MIDAKTERAVRYVVVGFFIVCAAIAGLWAQDSGSTGSSSIESTAILERDPVTDSCRVKHILIAWKELASVLGRLDEKTAARSQEEAEKLSQDLLEQLNDGADIDKLMAEYSADPGSAQTGRAYPVTPEAGLVAPFKALSLRLNKGEAGIVRTRFGYHIIQRVE